MKKLEELVKPIKKLKKQTTIKEEINGVDVEREVEVEVEVDAEDSEDLTNTNNEKQFIDSLKR
jgi:hypothetical protein